MSLITIAEQKTVVDAALANLGPTTIMARILREVENNPRALEGYSASKLEGATSELPVVPSQGEGDGREFEMTYDEKFVTGSVTVGETTIDVLLSEDSFGKSREAQEEYARQLEGRLATREEHLAYVDDLLKKEETGGLDQAEAMVLEIYRERYVRDSLGGMYVDGRLVGSYSFFGDDDHLTGALVAHDRDAD